MSFADKVFKSNCRQILKHGTDTKGAVVRPKWEDGTPAYTIKTFGVCNTYDLREEFPALTIRKTYLKSAMDEILWIFQKKDNNIHNLKSHVWDEWADTDGFIGKAYGYQIGKKVVFKTFDPEKLESHVNIENIFDKYPSYELSYNEKTDKYEVWLDQMDMVLYQLTYEPFSRRIMTSIWNVSELNEMNLQPCCWSMMFNVTDEREKNGTDKLTLNAMLIQRSNDMLAANNWNVCQYSLLLMMIAQSVGMEAGKLCHCINDMHIYDRHVELVEELLKRKEFSAPKVTLDPSVTDFYDFTTDHLTVEFYTTGDQLKIPIAI